MSLTKIRKGENIPSNAPKVSVIIPAYNIAPYITETLTSVFSQTYKDFEVIIVNDGSKDTSDLEIALAPFFDEIIYAEQLNSGAATARNSAISLARGAILAFIDGDDIWLKDFLQSQVDFLEKENFDMVYCNAEIFGEKLFEGRTFMQDAPSRGDFTPETLLSGDSNVITSGTILKKELLDKCGGFDAEAVRIEDFDLWFRLAKSGARIGYQREVLLKYRVRPDNQTGGSVRRAERSLYALEAIEKKYDFTVNEREIWEKRKALCVAELELERGKLCLLKGEYSEAEAHIAEANKYYRKAKLSLINYLIRFSPRLVCKLFEKTRPAEFSFILKN